MKRTKNSNNIIETNTGICTTGISLNENYSILNIITVMIAHLTITVLYVLTTPIDNTSHGFLHFN